MRTKSVDKCFGGRLPSAMRILSVVCLLAFVTGSLALLPTGCARDVTYLRESEKVIHLKKGDPAPHDGWLLSDDHLAELYDLLEGELPEECLQND